VINPQFKRFTSPKSCSASRKTTGLHGWTRRKLSQFACQASRVDADIVVVCTGGHPNVPFPAGDAVDEKTTGLSVNKAMLCEKFGADVTKPVWAVGDCTMYGGRRMFADPQIEALSASIILRKDGYS
jgi:hypothetical protein